MVIMSECKETVNDISKEVEKADKRKMIFWKGRRVNEKIYNLQVKQQSACKIVKSLYGTKNVEDNLNSYKSSRLVSIVKKKRQLTEINGRRIIDVKHLASQIDCQNCKSNLYLSNIVNETRHGLASIFSIKCSKCLFISNVTTDEQNEDSNKKMHFNSNTEIALG